MTLPAVLRLSMLILLLCARPLWADEAGAARLWDLMRMDGVLAVMRDEGVAQGRDVDASMLNGRGGATFAARIEAIYADPALAASTRAAFIGALTKADTAPMVAFFDSPLGQQIVGLELSARRALLDPKVERESRAKITEARLRGDPKVALIDEFITANDLLEENVAGSMNASLAFFTGLNAGGGMGDTVSEKALLDDVRAREPQIRTDTQDWLYGFLGLAYAPLTKNELARYVAFSKTPPGQALNAAIFRSFDAMLVAVSRRTGLEVARVMTGEDL